MIIICLREISEFTIIEDISHSVTCREFSVVILHLTSQHLQLALGGCWDPSAYHHIHHPSGRSIKNK